MSICSVHICEDHQIAIEGVKSILAGSERFDLQRVSQSAESCREALQINEPDILILDLELPDESGLNLLRDIRKDHARVKVLVLTMHNDPYLVEQVQKYEGNGYLLKDFGSAELLQALDAVRSGEFHQGPEVHTFDMPAEVEQAGASADPTLRADMLSTREKEIISLTAQGCSADQIAESLFISTHTVNTHRRNIYKKLNINGIKQLIRFAYDARLI